MKEIPVRAAVECCLNPILDAETIERCDSDGVNAFLKRLRVRFYDAHQLCEFAVHHCGRIGASPEWRSIVEKAVRYEQLVRTLCGLQDLDLLYRGLVVRWLRHSQAQAGNSWSTRLFCDKQLPNVASDPLSFI